MDDHSVQVVHAFGMAGQGVKMFDQGEQDVGVTDQVAGLAGLAVGMAG